jgi:hypothetical protein
MRYLHRLHETGGNGCHNRAEKKHGSDNDPGSADQPGSHEPGVSAIPAVENAAMPQYSASVQDVILPFSLFNSAR